MSAFTPLRLSLEEAARATSRAARAAKTLVACCQSFPIVENRNLTEWQPGPLPRSKKKRIRKKWRRKYPGRNVPDPRVIVLGDRFVAHPEIIEAMKEYSGYELSDRLRL